MAELTQQPQNGQGKTLRKRKRHSTKVDLTPMVDLGFLLITFFILTTTWSEPKDLRLYLPAGEISDTELGESTVLTLIPLENKKAFFYHGKLAVAMQKNTFGIVNLTDIRSIIMQKQIALDKHPMYSRKNLALIIKPTVQSIYRDIVAILDEVLINDLQHYSFVDLSADEKTRLSEMALLR